ncbi:MAG: SLBB domain-containing protein [Opitutaceae bacterium]|nr:SLBB domain-containing protein [Opitutaceae bacterium]
MKSHPHLLRSLLYASFASAVLLTGCQSYRARKTPGPTFTAVPANFVPQTVSDLPPLDPALLHRPTTEYRLGPGDVLDIEIVGEDASRSRSVVGPDGKVYFHMLPGIDVWGMTVGQTRASLAKEMRRFLREDPPMSVTLAAAHSQRIWVLGRLNKPGVYSLSAPMTLLEAISVAGGPAPATAVATRGGGMMSMTSNFGSSDEAADLRRAFVIRDGTHLRVDFERLLREGDLSQNIYLQPDDFVYLPSATRGSVHVLGAVNNPRAVEYTPRLTLLQAVAQAGGTNVREVHASQVAIVRGSLAEPRVATVDLNQILRGVSSDILLEPQDIVYVPHSPYRVGTRLVHTILDTFVRVVGVNEGARAVSDNANPVGVNVPLGPL